jgi:ABC-2 type transport system permease protein
MRGFIALLKKEIKEQLRTNRVIIVAGVFLFFGLSTPLLVKYTPELIKMAGEELGGFEMPPPTALQAMAEYTSNNMLFGILIAILIAMGAIAKERESGTAALVLSKPVGYPAFVLAKFKALSLTTLIAVALGGVACWGYTYLLFDGAPALGFLYQNILLLLYLMLAIAVTLLFSSIFKSQLAAGALGLVTIIVLSMVSALPWVGKYLPGELVSWGNHLLAGEPGGAAWGAVAVTVVLIAGSLYLAWTALRKKEI